MQQSDQMVTIAEQWTTTLGKRFVTFLVIYKVENMKKISLCTGLFLRCSLDSFELECRKALDNVEEPQLHSSDWDFIIWEQSN